MLGDCEDIFYRLDVVCNGCQFDFQTCCWLTFSSASPVHSSFAKNTILLNPETFSCLDYKWVWTSDLLKGEEVEVGHLVKLLKGFWKSWKIPGLDFWESLDQDFEKILGSHRITIERPLTIQTALHCLNSSMSAFLYCWGRLERYCKGRADQHLSKMWDGVGDGWWMDTP